jgi:hypothetical protein
VPIAGFYTCRLIRGGLRVPVKIWWGSPIAEDAVPLRMWNSRSDGCVFCDPCAELWFEEEHHG